MKTIIKRAIKKANLELKAKSIMYSTFPKNKGRKFYLVGISKDDRWLRIKISGIKKISNWSELYFY